MFLPSLGLRSMVDSIILGSVRYGLIYMTHYPYKDRKSGNHDSNRNYNNDFYTQILVSPILDTLYRIWFRFSFVSTKSDVFSRKNGKSFRYG